MSAGLWNRFKVWHSFQKNALRNEYFKKLILFDESWQICILCLAIEQMLGWFEGCPWANTKIWRLQLIYLFIRLLTHLLSDFLIYLLGWLFTASRVWLQHQLQMRRKDLLSWPGWAASWDRVNLHMEHTWPIRPMSARVGLASHQGAAPAHTDTRTFNSKRMNVCACQDENPTSLHSWEKLPMAYVCRCY